MNFWHPLLFGLDWMDPQWLLDHYGTAFFWVSLAIVVVECGLFFPILPGDSLLFAIGLFVASGALEITGRGEVVDIVVVLLSFITAALLGNVMGYEIGRKLGPPILRHEGRIIKKEYFVKSHEFFEKHGAGVDHRSLRANRAHLRHGDRRRLGDDPHHPSPTVPSARCCGSPRSPWRAISSARPSLGWETRSTS
ncbi:MAG: hypothetical protein R2709_09360 [Marmoricola sp.]